jgi:HlyD family secretion protein
MQTTWKFLKSKWGIGILVVIVLVAGWYFTHRGSTSYQFVTVTQGSIDQTVSVTGNTTPMQTVSLGFQTSGTIARVNYQLGNSVQAGDVIATLDAASLSAALDQAQATVAAQQATLAGLQAGPQSSTVAESQASLDVAQQNLANLYASIDSAATTAYTSANDATRTQLNTFFSNAETSQPELNFSTSNSQAGVTAVNLRVSASAELNEWQQELAGISASSSPTALSSTLNDDLAHLAVIENLLNTLSLALSGGTDLSSAQLATDQADVTTGLKEVNSAMSSLQTISQNIAAQQATVAQSQAALAVAQTGSTPQAIAAQQAQVQEAQAQVATAEANLQNAEIVAPISGVLTQQDAKVGQQASPGTPLVSIIGNSGFEVDAGVSETDIGKLNVGDMATMTLDAFPNQTFAGSVFYIAPAQTDTNGVITYLTKISFNQPNAELKSGLTANVDIQTKQDNNALILPEYAILQNNNGTFVETLRNGVATTTPVTLGIQDENGNVEVLSGVTAGEQVINIGLKTQ